MRDVERMTCDQTSGRLRPSVQQLLWVLWGILEHGPLPRLISRFRNQDVQQQIQKAEDQVSENRQSSRWRCENHKNTEVQHNREAGF